MNNINGNLSERILVEKHVGPSSPSERYATVVSNGIFVLAVGVHAHYSLIISFIICY